jgi:hypothetical protein
MRDWAEETTRGFGDSKNTQGEIYHHTNRMSGFLAEIAHKETWSHSIHKHQSEYYFDFISDNGKKIEIGSSQISLDPNKMVHDKFRFMLTSTKHERLQRSDYVVWYLVHYTYEKLWRFGWAPSKKIHNSSYDVREGDEGFRKGFKYPFTGKEFHAIHLNRFRNFNVRS